MYKNLLEAYSIVNTNLIESYNINYFDKFLIINLKKDEKRLQDTIKTLIKAGVDSNKIVRIDAVYDRWNGHLGCGKSHILALEYAIKHNLNNVVILEDDFEFIEKENVNNLINLFIQNFNNWDVLDFYFSYSGILQNTHIPGIVRNKGPTTGAVCYAVNQKFYTTFLNNRKEAVKKMQEYTDNYLSNCKENCSKIIYQSDIAIDQYQKSLQSKYNWYAFLPKLGYLRNVASSIMN